MFTCAHISHVFWCFNQKRFAYRDASRYACVKFNLPAPRFGTSRNAPPGTCAHTRKIPSRETANFWACCWKLCVDASHFWRAPQAQKHINAASRLCTSFSHSRSAKLSHYMPVKKHHLRKQELVFSCISRWSNITKIITPAAIISAFKVLHFLHVLLVNQRRRSYILCWKSDSRAGAVQ
jgi:hypothetical protein